MPITKCALAVITERGHNVVAPTWSDLEAEEEDFLERHVAELRSHVSQGDARGRFRPESTLLTDMQTAIADSGRDVFLQVADQLVAQLANAMMSGNSAPCVVAIVVQSVPTGDHFSFLKLDAEIEAAQLEQTEDGIRLKVFEDLLPSPGDIQKGFSWPDPRSPDSHLVLLDRVRQGSATKYFQTAFGIAASLRPKDTEDALAEELALLPRVEFRAAIGAVGRGGPADEVVRRIQAVVPTYRPIADALVEADRPPGFIRDSFSAAHPLRYQAQGIVLQVPADMRDVVETRRDGTGFITTIRTSTPLTPPADGGHA